MASNQDIVAAQVRLLSGVIKSALFWNLGYQCQIFHEEDGVFAHHGYASAGESFFEFMSEIGVFVPAGRRTCRVALRSDAIDGYAAHVVKSGYEFEKIIDAFAMLLLGGVADILPHEREAFPAKFYDKGDGTTSFDTRAMLTELVELGYAGCADNLYTWTDKMGPAMNKLYWPEWD